jgi:hypothetical protein
MLVNLGSISVLNKNVRPPKKPMVRQYTPGSGVKYVPGEKHTYDTPDRNTVVAYHRDRGEIWDQCKPTISEHFPVCEEWAYCFINGKWHFKTLTMSEWTPIPEGDLEEAQKKLYESLGY